MENGRITKVVLGWLLIVVSFGLVGCKGRESNPIKTLQTALSMRVENAQLCPTGNSKDIQELLKTSNQPIEIRLPAGCYQITTTVTIPACTRLVGAGADQTILYRDPKKTYSQPILKVSGPKNENCVTQISGLSLLGVRNTQDTGQDYGILVTNVDDFRLDHSYFEGFGMAAVRIEGDSSGVVDHCIFVENFKQGIDNLGYGVVVYGKGYWDDNLQPGGPKATFVEESLFSGNRHAIAANAGAHYVFRYNQVLRNVEACSVDAHGMGYGSAHGTQYVEIYDNELQDPVYADCGIGIRGGSGVIFENTIRSYKNPILLVLEWGTPEQYKAEYPALDQIQALYIWNNTIHGGPAAPQVDETGKGFIQLGRDYFTEPLAGYRPYTYPHPLAQGGALDGTAWPPSVSP